MAIISIQGRFAFTAMILHIENYPILPLSKVLIDTGSINTIFRTDHILNLGLELPMNASIRFMRGIGGREPVVEYTLTALQMDEVIISNFVVQLGYLDYGIDLDGIVGLDYLLRVNAIIDFPKRMLHVS